MIHCASKKLRSDWGYKLYLSLDVYKGSGEEFFADYSYHVLSELLHCTEQGLGLPISFPVVALS